MILKQFVIGFLDVNNYLLIDEETKEAVLIDCTEQNDAIDETLKEYGATLKYILLTHGHFDHVLGVNNYKNKYGCKAFIHNSDEIILQNVDKFMSGFGFGPAEIQHVDDFVKENQIIRFGKYKIRVIHTPGHSLGSVCYLVEDKLFSGDTIFFECVGRTDLLGGSFSQITASIKEKIFTLDENIKIQSITAQKMEALRHAQGALHLTTLQTHPIFLGDDIKGLELDTQNTAKDIIEDFMIASNGVTARFLEAHNFPSIRRVVHTPKRWDRIVVVAAEKKL